MKRGLLNSLLFVIPAFSFSQAPAIKWQKLYGGSFFDAAYAMAPTSDEGVILAGHTLSSDGDVGGVERGLGDIWVTKMDKTGGLTWHQRLGGSGYDDVSTIQQTSDGGYILAAFSTSNNGDVSGNHGNNDYWIVKLKSDGTIDWQKSLGGTESDVPWKIIQTADNGYVVCGHTKSNNGDVASNHGQWDYWIVKLNNAGAIQWRKALGGSVDEQAFDVVAVTDGYVIGGAAESANGDVTVNRGGFDCWLVKLDLTGGLVWQKTFGGAGDDVIMSVLPTIDGGFIMAANVRSIGGDIATNHGNSDIWLVKLKNDLSIEWQQSYGGSEDDFVSALKKSADGGYVLCGKTYSYDGDFPVSKGGGDGWVMKVSNTGTIHYAKVIGGTSGDELYAVHENADHTLVLCGFTHSTDEDLSSNYNNGEADVWLVQVEAFSTLPIDFIDFTGRYEGKAVSLNWRVSEESTSGSFTVLRSEDGRHYTRIATIDAQNSGKTGNYSFKDENLASVSSAVLYYQVLARDENGKETRTAIVRVTVKGTGEKLSLQGNPVALAVVATYQSPADQHVTVLITTVGGQVLVRKSFSVRRGVNRIDLPTGKLSAGTYVLTVAGKEKQSVMFVQP
ncbi:hypothetical protein [Paraflavitalea sp. CAU 1676]|uniref:hypothetical protein n=1 Tax=Paraflavitalea sp. CAU 1676 TaxID=3032598 RepID=UPI0023DB183D|nr:hypothetical protein [Paraflavitalea sp. CAU 1676]MDF2191691.1 hypothetical protein [Paraflavitalea sp. CAU 1676]